MELTKCIVAEFIECYKNNPVLWNTNCVDYQQAAKKKRSYRELLQVYRKLNSDATVLDVKKKINTLRSSYRREWRKVQESEQAEAEEELKAGSSIDGSVYQPKVWWYELMNFIGSMDNKYQSLSTEDLSMEDTDQTTVITGLEIEKRGARERGQTEADSDSEEYGRAGGIEDQDYECSRESEEEWLQPPKTKKQRLQKLPPLSPNQIASAPHADTPTPVQDDVYDHISKTWAHKLRGLPNTQRLLAERAINEILFEAELGTLQLNPIRMQNETPAAKIEISNGHFKTEPPSKLRSFFESV